MDARKIVSFLLSSLILLPLHSFAATSSAWAAHSARRNEALEVLYILLAVLIVGFLIWYGNHWLAKKEREQAKKTAKLNKMVEETEKYVEEHADEIEALKKEQENHRHKR